MKEKIFHIMYPFEVKAATTPSHDPNMVDTGDSEILKISGIANFYGNADAGEIYIDLAQEIVNPNGIDVSSYKNNPQILWQHDRSQTIGRGLSVTKRKDGLYIEAEIHSSAMCPEDFYRIKAGLVNRFSIGFKVISGSFKKVGEKNVYVIDKSKLYECSVVSLPCNEEASFQIVKSLPDGEEGFYSGDLTDQTVPNTLENLNENNSINEGDTVKSKFRDSLTEAEVVRFKELGMEAKLDEEVEVDLKSYIDSAIKAEVTKVLIAEKAAAELAEKEAQEAAEKAAAELAEKEAQEVAEKAAADLEAEKEEEALAIKSLEDIVADFKKSQVTE